MADRITHFKRANGHTACKRSEGRDFGIEQLPLASRDLLRVDCDACRRTKAFQEEREFMKGDSDA
jgi:hypothetical protein